MAATLIPGPGIHGTGNRRELPVAFNAHVCQLIAQGQPSGQDKIGRTFVNLSCFFKIATMYFGWLCYNPRYNAS